jgi:hypothetical protein
MIMVTIITVMVYAAVNLNDGGNRLNTIYAVNPVTWHTSIGFSIYTFEGIALVLPVQDVTAQPKKYPSILKAVVSSACIIYVIFGYFCCVSWGD